MRVCAGIALLFGMLLWHPGVARQGQGAGPKANEARTPVVVELFTSEGCSSCPPADALLTQLDKVQPFARAQVIALEEHVDYWDEQGWKDPFSSVLWTERQREYSERLGGGGPYTPEMVVDGAVGFVGSRGISARDAILQAAAAPKAKIELSLIAPAQNKSVTFRVGIEKFENRAPKDKNEVILGITETGLASAVKAGENSGQELHHSAVVRELRVLGEVGKNGQETFSAEPTVKLDSKWNVANLRAVIFVQERKSRRILGAAEIPVTP
ncbi:MAG TPA: DUF1223 domain-containing protein [Candidatus Acidoferrum sp.]|nr:DUF1223 domain-containing protein [Candidatus Acidoferrum sp.]